MVEVVAWASAADGSRASAACRCGEEAVLAVVGVVGEADEVARVVCAAASVGVASLVASAALLARCAAVSVLCRWTCDALLATADSTASEVSLSEGLTFAAVAATFVGAVVGVLREGAVTSARAIDGAGSARGVRVVSVSVGRASLAGETDSLGCVEARATCASLGCCRARFTRSGSVCRAVAVSLVAGAGETSAVAAATAADGAGEGARGVGVGVGSACATGVASVSRRAVASAAVCVTLVRSTGVVRGSA